MPESSNTYCQIAFVKNSMPKSYNYNTCHQNLLDRNYAHVLQYLPCIYRLGKKSIPEPRNTCRWNSLAKNLRLSHAALTPGIAWAKIYA
jgi:hypothetical protein